MDTIAPSRVGLTLVNLSPCETREVVLQAGALGEVLGTNPLAPPPERGAGNFVFLFETNINDAPDGATNVIPGVSWDYAQNDGDPTPVDAASYLLSNSAGEQ